jgi:conjugal transfer pilus assembly protein TraK
MTRTLICALGFGTLLGSVRLQAAEDPCIALPPVPRAVLLAASDPPAAIRHVSTEVSVEDAPDVGEAPAATLSLGPKTVRVSPGTTAIVEVAIDHLNRIVTPFTSPQVRTVSRATTQVDGNAIYVATASEEPVSLFITEAGDTATTISLTLAPRHIPPREVRLVLTGGVVPVRTAAPAIKPPRPVVRNDQPYVEHIASAFRALAQNRVPVGYGLRKVGEP